jgi:hypothetical protein
MRFPVVTSTNLSQQKLTLPRDLGGERNIVLIAFQRRQQADIDSWLPLVQQLEATYPVHYYELPVIQQLNLLARSFINQGMRMGIPDGAARERTITLYVDKVAFRKALDLPHEDDIYVLLIDRQGRVWWRTSGVFTPEKGQALSAAVEDSCK